MTLRQRLLRSFLGLVLLPLLVFVGAMRWVAARELRDLYQDRTAALSELAREELAREAADVAVRLQALAGTLHEERPFSGPHTRNGLDYGPRAMQLMGLDLLEILDDKGRILSSGHFRNQFGNSAGVRLQALREVQGQPLLLRAERPRSSFVALAHLDSLTLEGQRYFLIGGVESSSAWLARLVGAAPMELILACGDAVVGSRPGEVDLAARRIASGLVSETPVYSWVNAEGLVVGPARLWSLHEQAPLRAALLRLDLLLLLLVVLVGSSTLLASRRAARRMSDPLERLSASAARIDLEAPAAPLSSTRGAAEVRALAQVLAAMVERLQSGSRQLSEAERRAALGDMARQINHDIRNGIAPIRNTLRFLGQVAERNPAGLKHAFAERRESLGGGLSYLEELAGQYARLRPSLALEPVDLNAVIRAAVGGEALRMQLAADLPPVLAESIGLRRIVLNLVRNALEATPDLPQGVEVLTEASEARGARLIVRDQGPGIAPENHTRVFQAFHTTKNAGSGLGLAIVQRLSADYAGRISLASAPGAGTTISITFPPLEEA